MVVLPPIWLHLLMHLLRLPIGFLAFLVTFGRNVTCCVVRNTL